MYTASPDPECARDTPPQSKPLSLGPRPETSRCPRTRPGRHMRNTSRATLSLRAQGAR